MSVETPAVVQSAPSEAPSGAPATPSPAAPAAASPSSPSVLTKQEARRGLKEIVTRHSTPAPSEPAPVASETPAPAAPMGEPEAGAVLDAQGRAHDPATGQFLPSEANAEGEADAPAAPESAPLVDETASEPAASTPPSTVRIELPEGHSLRDQGLSYLEVSPEQERAVRALVNADTRRAQVQEAEARAREAQQRAMRLEAQLAAREKLAGTPVLDAETAAKLAAIREVDPALADWMEAAARSEHQQKLQAAEAEEVQSREQQWQQQQVAEAGTRFRQEVQVQAKAALPPEIVALPQYGEAFERARYHYGAELERREAMGAPAELNPQEFLGFLRHQLVQDPAVQQIAERVRQQAESQQREAREKQIREEAEAAARAAAAEAERRRLLQASQKTPPNPLGQIPSQVRSDRLSTTPETEDLSQLSGPQLKNHFRQRVRQNAGRYFQAG